MKKIIVTFGVALALVGGFSSCNKGANSASEADKAFGDSVAQALGEFAGANSAMQLNRMKEMNPEQAEKFSKEAFLKGLYATASIVIPRTVQTPMEIRTAITGETPPFVISVSTTYAPTIITSP